MHFQRHSYQPPLHSKFVKITQKIAAQGSYYIFNQSRGAGPWACWSLIHSLLPLFSSPCRGSWPPPVFSRLWELLASCHVWLTGGREKPEHFFPSLSPSVAVAMSALWPQIPAGPQWPHFIQMTPVPCLWKHPFSLCSQPHPWGEGGSAFQLLLISWLPSHSHLAFQPYYVACIKFPALNLRLNPQSCFSFSDWALADIVVTGVRGLQLYPRFSGHCRWFLAGEHLGLAAGTCWEHTCSGTTQMHWNGISGRVVPAHSMETCLGWL